MQGLKQRKLKREIVTFLRVLIMIVLVSAMCLVGCSSPRDTSSNNGGEKGSINKKKPSPKPPAIKPQNLFLITIDTLRPDHLGCYGNPIVRTPNIDRLAGNGQQFRECIVPLGRTNPSLASILTSRYPHEHGVRALWDVLPPEEETLAERLKTNGFTTSFVNGNSLLNPKSGITQGFDSYHGPRSGFVQFFEPNKQTQSREHRPRAGWKADRIVDAAQQELEQMKSSDHLFLWTHFMDPHWSYHPPAIYQKLYATPIAPKILQQVRNMHAGELRYQNTMSPETRQYFRDLYGGEVAYTDHELGRLLRYVNDAGLMKKALLVLTSDHGETLGEKGMYFCHGDEVYRESIHVPLIIVNMNRRVNSVKEEAVDSLSISGRILHILGLKKLVSEQDHSVIYSETDAWSMRQNPRKYFDGVKGKWRMVRENQFKYIRIPHPDRDIIELYNLEDDPAETENIVSKEPAVAEKLSRELNKWINADPLAEMETGKPTPASSDLQDKLRNLGYIQ